MDIKKTIDEYFLLTSKKHKTVVKITYYSVYTRIGGVFIPFRLITDIGEFVDYSFEDNTFFLKYSDNRTLTITEEEDGVYLHTKIYDKSRDTSIDIDALLTKDNDFSINETHKYIYCKGVIFSYAYSPNGFYFNNDRLLPYDGRLVGFSVDHKTIRFIQSSVVSRFSNDLYLKLEGNDLIVYSDDVFYRKYNIAERLMQQFFG